VGGMAGATAAVGPSEADLAAMAEHFDRTDAADLPWEPAEHAEIARPELEQVSLRLPKEDLTELRRRAARAGIGYTTLIRMLVRQHLRSPVR
jgi:predicted DNA binding CopG/RHH family protein